ncbi:hypothetical protein OG742_11385 [Streptomyces sp. NBC_00828]|uniref:hypothetical protein n=1 Tax=Streptomyces sp. NBC_00828 TaxID=2903678 RepID=UPI003865857E
MSASESPQPGTNRLGAKGSDDHDAHVYSATSGEFVTSASICAGPLSFEEVFSGRNLDDIELPPPCRTITLTLCGSVLDGLEEWAEFAHMEAADLAASLIVHGLEGGES